jgi:hypothetical protein
VIVCSSTTYEVFPAFPRDAVAKALSVRSVRGICEVQPSSNRSDTAFGISSSSSPPSSTRPGIR